MKVKEAKGLEGYIDVIDGTAHIVVYHKPGEPTWYPIAHSDMFVMVTDPEACIYDKGDRRCIDHSPQTLYAAGIHVEKADTVVAAQLTDRQTEMLHEALDRLAGDTGIYTREELIELTKKLFGEASDE